MKEETIQLPDGTTVNGYIFEDFVAIRIKNLPKTEQPHVEKFMLGQTVPLIEGETSQDFVYLQDYINFRAMFYGGKQLFWD
jgi:hypothetical protein